MTTADLPVIDPSAACSPAVAAVLRTEIENARFRLSVQEDGRRGAAVDAVAARLAALDDAALLDAWRVFTDRAGAWNWLLYEADTGLAQEAAAAPEPVPDAAMPPGVTMIMRPGPQPLPPGPAAAGRGPAAGPPAPCAWSCGRG